MMMMIMMMIVHHDDDGEGQSWTKSWIFEFVKIQPLRAVVLDTYWKKVLIWSALSFVLNQVDAQSGWQHHTVTQQHAGHRYQRCCLHHKQLSAHSHTIASACRHLQNILVAAFEASVGCIAPDFRHTAGSSMVPRRRRIDRANADRSVPSSRFTASLSVSLK